MPSVYQGLYNPLNRLVEDELLPEPLDVVRLPEAALEDELEDAPVDAKRLRICLARLATSFVSSASAASVANSSDSSKTSAASCHHPSAMSHSNASSAA